MPLEKVMIDIGYFDFLKTHKDRITDQLISHIENEDNHLWSEEEDK